MSLPDPSQCYIGLMSGTSMDAIDAVLVDFSNTFPRLLATHTEPLPLALKRALQSFDTPSMHELQRFGELDQQIGVLFAQAAQTLIQQQHLDPKKIRAIGSHGQTIRHSPQAAFPFTLQIGNPNIIATLTGITTIADFRRADMAVGGQGAPLVPAFHQALFQHAEEDRMIINIGGIANITYLPKHLQKEVIGFDTGPGNTLMDAWILRHSHASYDAEGDWASQGTVEHELLNTLLADPFFQQPSPKSTGCDYFNLDWIAQRYPRYTALMPVNIQATLLELTARSITQAIQSTMPKGAVFLCGGGAYNTHLMQRLSTLNPNYQLTTTATLHIEPKWLEAIAFAWLAYQTLQRKPGNLPSVTGATRRVILGGIYQVSDGQDRCVQ